MPGTQRRGKEQARGDKRNILDPVSSKVFLRALRFHRSIDRSINPSVNLSINRLIYLSISPSVHRSIDRSIYKSIPPSINQSIDRSIDRSIDQLIHISTDRSIDRPMNQPLQPSIDQLVDLSMHKEQMGIVYFIVLYYMMWSHTIVSHAIQSINHIALLDCQTIQNRIAALSGTLHSTGAKPPPLVLLNLFRQPNGT